MRFGEKVQCTKCNSQESLMWHRLEGGIQCNDCVEDAAKLVQQEAQVAAEKQKCHPKKITRSTRSYRTRQNPNAVQRQVTPKGKGRRQIFKRNLPIKLPASRATITTMTSTFHNGIAYRVGDIVSLQDVEGGIYYATIKGLLMDQYCEKSATLTWLLPRTARVFGMEQFNPMDYVAAYDDEMPRHLDCLEFEMHSPEEYYRNNLPVLFPRVCPGPRNVIWGRLNHLC